MDYNVQVGGEIDFGATGMAEILQNVRTIMTTVAGTVPYDRAFGIDSTAVDRPPEVAQALFSAAATEAIETYEPRVQVVSVTYPDADDGQGRLKPTVTVRLRDGVTV